MSYERIKFFYEIGMWNKPMIKNSVKRGIITKEQYKEITGEEYTK